MVKIAGKQVTRAAVTGQKKKAERTVPLSSRTIFLRDQAAWVRGEQASAKQYREARTVTPNKPGEGDLRIWARGPGYPNIRQRAPIQKKK